MIDRKLIEDLVKLAVDNNLAELDFADGDQSLAIRRSFPPTLVSGGVPMPAAPLPASFAPAGPAPSGGAQVPAPASADTSGPVVKSPMVGTFYSRANPDAAPFVTVGAKVTESTVVCLVEAMKVFNEIKAGVKGTITEMLVKDGEAVEYNQPLFRVRP